MGKFIASEAIKMMNKKNISRIDSKILILGITFKENCNDIRNSIQCLLNGIENQDLQKPSIGCNIKWK